jgi:Tfp pilus assembly protein FimT
MKMKLSLRAQTPHGYLLAEALVYIGVVVVLVSLAAVMLVRCIDSSLALRRAAAEISAALETGELWRADVRAASRSARLETDGGQQALCLTSPHGEVAYRFSSKAVFRRIGQGPWVRVLDNVRASTMEPDPRRNVTAWRWELELQPRAKGAVKPSRIRPLFTFFAVPKT